MEEARIPEFIINNGEQTYPETVESQKIETREEENVSWISLIKVKYISQNVLN